MSIVLDVKIDKIKGLDEDELDVFMQAIYDNLEDFIDDTIRSIVDDFEYNYRMSIEREF